MSVERYQLSSSGELVHSRFELPFAGASVEDVYVPTAPTQASSCGDSKSVSRYRMARGSYRQLHEVVHPEMLFFKRQVEQLQQQHTALQDALQDNSFLVQSLQAKIVALEADIVELEQKNTKE